LYDFTKGFLASETAKPMARLWLSLSKLACALIQAHPLPIMYADAIKTGIPRYNGEKKDIKRGEKTV
jgi:hypothetical protein